MSLFKKPNIADFFLTEAHPYSKKRSVKLLHVGVVLAAMAVIVLAIGTYFEDKAKHDHEVAQAAKEAEKSATPQGSGNQSAPSASDQSYLNLSSGGARSIGRGGARQLNASQIIKRGESSGDVLPMGTSVKVRLIGQVESVDANSPVTALVVEDALSPSRSTVIPRGTKVIGNGQLDNARERLQVRFHTLVFPEGEQFSISGLAAMSDGTSGLVGDYSSGAFKRHAGEFIGSFLEGCDASRRHRHRRAHRLNQVVLKTVRWAAWLNHQ